MSRGNLILFNKPFGILSQFSGDDATLAKYIPLKGYYLADHCELQVVTLLSAGDLQCPGDWKKIQPRRHGRRLQESIHKSGNIDTIESRP